jgi:hypothetical protein
LANLVLLCSRHHHAVVHGEGFQLTLSPHTRALHVATETGKPVPHLPGQPWRPAAELDPTGSITSRTLPPIGYDKLNLHYAVEVLLQHSAYRARAA